MMRKGTSDSPCNAFLAGDGRDAREGPGRKGRDRSLHSHLDGLEWAQRNIRDKFCRRAGRQVQRRLPAASPFLSSQITVEFLEELVATILECALGLWSPAISNPLSDYPVGIRSSLTEYPKNVGLQPVNTPRRPSAP
jgi:hypothetical protein